MTVSPLHQFMQTFLESYRANRPFLVVRASRPAFQCLRIFHQHAMVERYGYVVRQEGWRRFAPTVTPNLAHRYLLVWLHMFPPTQPDRSQRRWLVERQAGNRPSSKAPHRLELIRRPTLRTHQKRSLRSMVDWEPNLGAVYLLETPLGVLTSLEARRRRVGGHAFAVL